MKRRSSVRAAPDLDHFVDIDEMVIHPLAAVETGKFGFLEDLLEIAVVGVSQYPREIAAGPMFVSRGIHTLDALEGRRLIGS
jgi:hypothetical protein